jgi:hypothetical protein
VRKISLYLAQSLALFIRPLAFGHVYQDTHEFADIAGRVENRMTYSMHVSRRTVWKKESELRLEILSRGVCSLGAFNHPRSIFWMHTQYHFFE